MLRIDDPIAITLHWFCSKWLVGWGLPKVTFISQSKIKNRYIRFNFFLSHFSFFYFFKFFLHKCFIGFPWSMYN